MPEGLSVRVVCPELLQLSLNSRNGPPRIGGSLTVIGCDVLTVPSRDTAAAGPPPPEWSANYFGSSSGTIRLEDCRMLMPSEVRAIHVLSCSFSSEMMSTQAVCGIPSALCVYRDEPY